MSGHSLKKQAAYLLFGRVITLLIAAVSPMILVRMLSVDQFGIFRQIIFIENVLLVLVMMRIPQNLYYFFPRTEGAHRELFSQTFSILAMLSAAGTLAFYVLARFLDILPTGVTGEYIVPIAVYIFIESVSSILDQIFVLEKRSTAIPVLSASSQTLRLGLIIGAVVAYGTVLAIVYALIIYSATRLVFMIAYLVKRYGITFGIKDKNLFRDQLRYGIPMAGAAIVALIGNQFEKGVITALASPADFALYSVGSLGVMYAITIVYTSMGDVAVPRFGELAMKGDLQSIKSLWHRIVSVSALLTIPVVVFAFIFAEEIITVLFTSNYISSALIWRVNLLILIIQMLGYGYIPTALGKTKMIFLGNCVRAAFVVPVSLLLVSKVGILGGAIAFVTGFWLNGLIQLFATQKAIRLSLKELLPWKRLFVIAAFSAIPAFIVSHIDIRGLGLRSISTLAVTGSVYFSIVALTYWQAGYVNLQEIQKLVTRKT